MTTHILDQDAPGLAERLQATPAEIQRRIAARAALFTAEKLNDLHTTTIEVLDELRLRGTLSSERAKSVLVLSDRADDTYFELKERRAPEAEWGKLFSEARLLRGISVAFGASPPENIADAVYEFTKALDEPEAILRFIETELTGAL